MATKGFDHQEEREKEEKMSKAAQLNRPFGI